MRETIRNIARWLVILPLSVVMVACSRGVTAVRSEDLPTVALGGEHRVHALGEYRVKYVDAKIVKDSDGHDVVIFTFDFINKSKISRSFVYTIHEAALQDGVELDRAEPLFVGEDDNQFAPVEPGKHVYVKQAWILRSLLSDITVKLSCADDPFGAVRIFTVRATELPTR